MPTEPFANTFGVEIECYMPQGATHAQAAEAIRTRINRPVHHQSYNHVTPRDWKMVTDGSLGDYTRGIEIVSPVLVGLGGVAEVTKVIQALSDFGCTVSKKCGLHVHVGMPASNPALARPSQTPILDDMKRLLTMYSVFEPVIDSLMPPSRRANDNQYCASMTSCAPTTIAATQNWNALVNLVPSRFRKLNLLAWSKYHTVEFRQHSGTMEATKARYWVLTCLRMVAAAMNGATIQTGTAATGVASTPVNQARVGSKSWQVGQMMLRPEGVTGPEARAAVGWPAISMPQQAAICGLQFTTTQVGRTVRYFARTAQAEVVAQVAVPPTPITLLGFLDFIGADVAEREYMLQRQADLGGPISWAA